jgi:hypothetical protein
MWGEIKLIKAVEIWYLGHVCYIIEWLPNRIIIYLVANWSTVVMKGSYGQEPVPKAKTLYWQFVDTWAQEAALIVII